MEFMLLFSQDQDRPPDPECRERMQALAADLARQGKLRRGARLAGQDEAARVRVRDGRAVVLDGPFAESREVVGGFWVVDVASREEAIAIAGRTRMAAVGGVSVSPFQFRTTVDDPGSGKPFLFAFLLEEGLTDCDGEKLREMIAHGEKLHVEGRFLETAPLSADPTPALVTSRQGKLLVTDGPFAEAKDVVGGYSIIRAADRAEAIEMAKIYPHSRWGRTEVREILHLDSV